MKDKSETILLAHGSGGQLGHELVENVFARHFDNELLAELNDAAMIRIPYSVSRVPCSRDSQTSQGTDTQHREHKVSRLPVRDASRNTHHASSRTQSVPTALEGRNRPLAFTTDSYVISPLFFPGGDIGKLAVCGTVNDLAVTGAEPRYLSAGFILEEGLPMETLERVVASMAETARAAGVQVVTGDTKVVDHGAADGLFINTAGIGFLPEGAHPMLPSSLRLTIPG